MSHKFLSQLKNLELLSKSESKTITGGYGAYGGSNTYCNLRGCPSGFQFFRSGPPVARVFCNGNYASIYHNYTGNGGQYCWR